jgi:beta-lactamase regulating signal transducer with metallopeptidase domain
MTLTQLSDVGRASGSSLLVLSWFLTYQLHGLVWVAFSLLLTRLGRASFATRHALWKLALFAPLVTALWSVVPMEAVRQLRAQVLEARESAHEQDLAAAFSSAPRSVASQPESGPSFAVLVPPVVPARVGGYAGALAVLLLSGAALGFVRFVAAALRFWCGLHGRARVLDARLLARLACLRERSRAPRLITLTRSAYIQSPLILGRREICVPLLFPGTLSEHEIDAVFAHELAHLERRDGLWFPLAGLVQTVLWFSPLNHLSAARFRQTAELSCDDRAVALSGDALSLARALTQVASAALGNGRDALCPAMARPARGLRARVERLLWNSPRLAPKRWLIACLVVLGLCSAGVRVHSVEAREQDRQAGAARSAGVVAHTLTASAVADAELATLSREMSALAQREALLEAELQPLLRSSAPALAESMRVLSLQQALRHVRGEQLWVEQRVRRAPQRAHQGPPEGDRSDVL